MQEIRQGGRTVFLTTHFMEEAERLCDRVLILDHGSLVAFDTPEALVRTLTYAVRLLRGLWFGKPWSELWLPTLVLGVILIVCGLLAARLFRWE